MNLIAWLIVGSVIGWLASLVVGTDAPQVIGLNVVVGITGALLGGWLLSPEDSSLLGLLVSFCGAVLLLLIVNLVRTGRAR